MFMAIIGKPLYDEQGHLIHDGKYDIFPFVYKQAAKKGSKNRPAGTIETKATQNINREEIRKMLITAVLPAIRRKWPIMLPKKVLIKWDNARPHQVPGYEEFLAAMEEGGFNIEFVFQPPQSPDPNVLDLGLFRAIQSIQHRAFPKNLDALINRVKEAYDEFDPTVNKHTWITLQSCMIEILKCEGGNNYKIPHMGKERLERLGLLPEILEVNQELVDQSCAFLNNNVINTNTQEEAAYQFEVDAD
ncbi:uncharacterized protein LOC110734777 [Chenopodium quinoa]|uniref:uncharacterized protein LOC110734777 n=1 Tax=Chenopodium quinoa TaxID=63459 RepID=UPI000B772285|nr:uncharacterized protein LOC110734777 [Chenopodium quinoa]